MDAYVFVRQADEDVIGRLAQLSEEMAEEVRFVAPLAGPHDAFVALEAPSLKSIQRLVHRNLRGAGARDSDTSIVVMAPQDIVSWPHLPLPLPRKWIIGHAVESLTRIRVEAGRAVDVLISLGGLEGALGAAIVAGEYDILFGMGGDSFADVAGRLLNQLQQVDGIRSTISSFMSNEQGAS